MHPSEVEMDNYEQWERKCYSAILDAGSLRSKSHRIQCTLLPGKRYTVKITWKMWAYQHLLMVPPHLENWDYAAYRSYVII